MAQILPQYDGPVQETEEMERDYALREQLEAQVLEAAERKTFHDVESERWDRIGRAAGAALVELNAQRPVEQTSPEMWVKATKSVVDVTGLGVRNTA